MNSVMAKLAMTPPAQELLIGENKDGHNVTRVANGWTEAVAAPKAFVLILDIFKQ